VAAGHFPGEAWGCRIEIAAMAANSGRSLRDVRFLASGGGADALQSKRGARRRSSAVPPKSMAVVTLPAVCRGSLEVDPWN
jgi:hypothetical protein